MSIGYKLGIVALAVVLAGLIVPALAQNDSDSVRRMPHQGMDMRSMGQGMMHGAMMSHGMMSGGCAGMMQSMNGGGGQPNAKWQEQSN
jgi:hypothetical protein